MSDTESDLSVAGRDTARQPETSDGPTARSRGRAARRGTGGATGGGFGARALPWISTPILLAIAFYIWKLVIAVFGVSPFVLPEPEEVAKAFGSLVSQSSTWPQVRTTVIETVVGFGFALLGGLVVGSVLGRLLWLERATRPMVIASQVVPKVALVPLFVIWFGFGMTSKIIVAAILAFFPIMLNVLLGVRSVEPGHHDVMRSLNARRWDTFWRMEFHSMLPYVFTGMEVAIVLAVIGAIVGEYLAGNAGLGYLIVKDLNALDAQHLYAVIALLTIVGFLLFLFIGLIKRLMIPWHQSVSGGE